MKTKADPLAIFRESNSPIALHVRKRWMGGAGRAVALAGGTVKHLEDKQAEDGSWNGTVAHTIQNLFALWLLLERADRSVNRALDWMLETGYPAMQCPRENGATYSNMFFRTSRHDRQELRRLMHLPFTSGCSGFVKTGAALFFAVEFGRAGDERVEQAFASINRTAQVRNGRLCSGPCANNIHLALAVHPRYSGGAGMARVLSWLERQIKPTGSWDKGIPFFPTFWMLAHLKSRKSNELFRQALVRVERSQNSDGTWGRGQKLLDTFLVLDSLSRKGIELETP